MRSMISCRPNTPPFSESHTFTSTWLTFVPSTHSPTQLNSGHMMPQLQLGLYMMSGREVLSSIPHALEMGYRGFDSAQMYHNESEAGQAISSWLPKSGGPAGAALTREDIFYTSKLASNSDDYDAVRRSIAKSVKACGLGYIDLFLLHSPYGGPNARRESWRAVEDAIKDGEVRSGGVSNYGVRHVSVSHLLVVFPLASLHDRN